MRSFRLLLGSMIWLSASLIAVENFFLFSLWVIAPWVWHDLVAGHGQDFRVGSVLGTQTSPEL
jgi:hypothetical protein